MQTLRFPIVFLGVLVTASIPTPQAIAIALAHHRAGRLADAEGIYRQVLTSEPNHPKALDYFGVLAVQTGRLELAAGLLRRAIAGEPANAALWCNLGECLRKGGKYDEAIAALRESIRLNPDLAVAHNNLGTALGETLQLEAAVASYQRAIDLKPDYAPAHSNLGNALKDLGRLDHALAALHAAIALRPDDAESHNNLGVTLAAAGRTAEAIDAYGRAIARWPGYGNAWSNLGNALAAEGRHDEALAASGKAVELEPRNVQSHWNYAVIVLRSGDLLLGWQEYEWRWRTQDYFPRPSPRFHPPRVPTLHWTGGGGVADADGKAVSDPTAAIFGKTLFLHAEQGFGDTIHFCRYAPLAAARGARVILEVHPELHRLMQGLNGVETTIARGQTVPRFDLHCPLMSLPLAFRTTMQTIPADVPYLRPDAQLIERWSAIVGPRQGRLRVGLCWAGSPTHADDIDRSIALEQLAPLAGTDAIFFSLQKGPASAQAANPPAGMQLFDHTPRLEDFADTAALIANLDLVITVDTAVAHLAGAMGKPVWVLLRRLADWRWRDKGSETPWYPSMVLFRQEKRGDWGQVIARVARDLRTAVVTFR
jgi:tetratricopeptide (TPR) repeat protein